MATRKNSPKSDNRGAAASTSASAKALDVEGGDYCKPPENTRFKAGTSGNPNGRPKGSLSINILVREMMTETVRITTATGVVEMTRIEAMLRAMFGLAVEGNQRAQSLLVNLYKVAVPEEQEPPDHGMANFHEFPFEFLNVGFLD